MGPWVGTMLLYFATIGIDDNASLAIRKLVVVAPSPNIKPWWQAGLIRRLVVTICGAIDGELWL